MSRSIWLLALLSLAILSIVAALGVTRPIRVALPSETRSESTAPAVASTDAGVLDSLLDAVHLEHSIKHGR